MTRNLVIVIVAGSLALLLWAHSPASAANSIGVGVHYWTAVKDIDIENVDRNGFSVIGSFQNRVAGFSTLELDLEIFGEGYAGAKETVFSPQGYLLFGRSLYGGAGVGINYSDGSYSDPFFALRAGVDLEVLPAIHLDLNANYRFENWDFERIKGDVKTGNITLGAIVRLGF